MKKKLKKLLKRYNHTQNNLACVLGLTYQTLSAKVNGHTDFTQSEIFKIMILYKLTPEEVVDIFFSNDTDDEDDIDD